MTFIMPVLTIGNFYLNQKQIAEEFCENKSQPERHCEGHCYLKKQLRPAFEQDDLWQNSTETYLFWSYAFENLPFVQLNVITYEQLSRNISLNNYYFSFAKRLLDPPELKARILT